MVYSVYSFTWITCGDCVHVFAPPTLYAMCNVQCALCSLVGSGGYFFHFVFHQRATFSLYFFVFLIWFHRFSFLALFNRGLPWGIWNLSLSSDPTICANEIPFTRTKENFSNWSASHLLFSIANGYYYSNE